MSTAKKAIIIVVIALVVVGLGVGGFAWAQKNTVKDETTSATVLVNGLNVEYEPLARGTAVTVTGTQGDYYQASVSPSKSGESAQVLIPKSYVRLSSEATPAAWTGYASEGAKLYNTVALSGTEVAALEKNAEVTVEDSFAGMLFVKTADGKNGYTAASSINKEKAEEEEQDATTSENSGNSGNSSYSGTYYYYSYDDDGGSSYSGGGSSGGGSSSSGGGGSSSGGGGGTPSSSGDGGEISLGSLLSTAAKTALGVQIAEAATENASATATSMNVTATVLGDGVMSYLGIFNRGDVIQVKPANSNSASASPSPNASSSTAANAKPETVEAIFGSISAPIEKRLLRLEGEAEYTTWTGYATADAPLYSNYTLTTVAKTLPLNTELQVVDNLSSFYVVYLDGAYYYIPSNSVSTLKAEEPKEEAAEETASTDGGTSYSYSYNSYSYSDGGSSSGDSGSGSSGGSSGGGSESGSSGGGSSSGGGEEWTPAVL